MNLDIIKKFEGLRLKAYRDSKGVWTIGYGNTFYEDGTFVKKGDLITKERAESLLPLIAEAFWSKIKKSIKVPINDNQKTALISFTYNVGPAGFLGSELLKAINSNAGEQHIRQGFMNWRFSGGAPILTTRRQKEADLYFKP